MSSPEQCPPAEAAADLSASDGTAPGQREPDPASASTPEPDPASASTPEPDPASAETPDPAGPVDDEYEPL